MRTAALESLLVSFKRRHCLNDGNAQCPEMNRPAKGNHAKRHPVGKGVWIPESSGEVTKLLTHLQAGSGQVLKW